MRDSIFHGEPAQIDRLGLFLVPSSWSAAIASRTSSLGEARPQRSVSPSSFGSCVGGAATAASTSVSFSGLMPASREHRHDVFLGFALTASASASAARSRGSSGSGGASASIFLRRGREEVPHAGIGEGDRRSFERLDRGEEVLDLGRVVVAHREEPAPHDMERVLVRNERDRVDLHRHLRERAAFTLGLLRTKTRAARHTASDRRMPRGRRASRRARTPRRR